MPPPDPDDRDTDYDREYEADDGPTANERSMGLIAHLLGFFTGFIGPAALLLAADKSAFARRHAKESLNYQVSLTFYAIAILVVGSLVGFAVYVPTEKQHYGLLSAGAAMTLLGLVMLVFEVVCIVRAAKAANRGHDYRYPLTIRLF